MTGRLYDLAVWHRLRAKQLQDEPLCRHCHARGIIELATDVDHIVPIANGGAPLDQSNLQSLCHLCHTRKTNSENGMRVRTGCDINGIPFGGRHGWTQPVVDADVVDGGGAEKYPSSPQTPRW